MNGDIQPASTRVIRSRSLSSLRVQPNSLSSDSSNAVRPVMVRPLETSNTSIPINAISHG
ncbi:hypothetical protein D9M71_708480 [compost metagenome]